MLLYLFQLFVIIIACLVTWMLAASQKLIRNNTARPQIYLFRVAFSDDLLRCHVKRCTSALLCVFAPILLSREAEIDNFDFIAVLFISFK